MEDDSAEYLAVRKSFKLSEDYNINDEQLCTILNTIVVLITIPRPKAVFGVIETLVQLPTKFANDLQVAERVLPNYNVLIAKILMERSKIPSECTTSIFLQYLIALKARKSSINENNIVSYASVGVNGDLEEKLREILEFR